jgi:hypothetical protein
VAGVSKEREQHVYGSIAGSTYGSVYQGTGSVSGGVSGQIGSYTTVHDQFFVIDAEGNERAFQMSNWNLALRDGQVLSAVWAGDKGPLVLFRNHNTRVTVPDPAPIKDLLQANGAALIFLVTVAMVGLCTGVSEIIEETPWYDDLLLGTIMGIFFALPLMVVFGVLASMATGRRMGRYVGPGVRAIEEALDAAAAPLLRAPAHAGEVQV